MKSVTKLFIHLACLIGALVVAYMLAGYSREHSPLLALVIACWQIGRWFNGLANYLVE